jgi:hypothetical protein
MSRRSELIQKTNLTENIFRLEETIRMQMIDASSKGAAPVNRVGLRKIALPIALTSSSNDAG